MTGATGATSTSGSAHSSGATSPANSSCATGASHSAGASIAEKQTARATSAAQSSGSSRATCASIAEKQTARAPGAALTGQERSRQFLETSSYLHDALRQNKRIKRRTLKTAQARLNIVELRLGHIPQAHSGNAEVQTDGSSSASTTKTSSKRDRQIRFHTTGAVRSLRPF